MERWISYVIALSFLFSACSPGVKFSPNPPQIKTPDLSKEVFFALKELPTDCYEPFPVRVIYSYNSKSNSYKISRCDSLVFSSGTYSPAVQLSCTGSYSNPQQAGNFTITTPNVTCQGPFSSSSSGNVNLACQNNSYIKFSGHNEFVTKPNGQVRQMELWGSICKQQPPPPPSTGPAFVTALSTSSSGAIATLSGPVQALRYSYDSSGGWINLTSPFNSPYTISKIWPQGTTYVCAQAQGTDGTWHGATVNDAQTCNSVTVPPPPPTPRTVSWDPVTTDYNGQPLTNLAGYIIYYTDVSGDWSRFPSIIVYAPNTSYVINSLQVGVTYYFAVTAFLTDNTESAKSEVFVFTQY